MNRYPEYIQEKVKELNLIGYSREEILRLAFNDCSVLMKELTLESNWNQEVKGSIAKAQAILMEQLYKNK